MIRVQVKDLFKKSGTVFLLLLFSFVQMTEISSASQTYPALHKSKTLAQSNLVSPPHQPKGFKERLNLEQNSFGATPYEMPLSGNDTKVKAMLHTALADQPTSNLLDLNELKEHANSAHMEELVQFLEKHSLQVEVIETNNFHLFEPNSLERDGKDPFEQEIFVALRYDPEKGSLLSFSSKLIDRILHHENGLKDLRKIILTAHDEGMKRMIYPATPLTTQAQHIRNLLRAYSLPDITDPKRLEHSNDIETVLNEIISQLMTIRDNDLRRDEDDIKVTTNVSYSDLNKFADKIIENQAKLIGDKINSLKDDGYPFSFLLEQYYQTSIRDLIQKLESLAGQITNINDSDTVYSPTGMSKNRYLELLGNDFAHSYQLLKDKLTKMQSLILQLQVDSPLENESITFEDVVRILNEVGVSLEREEKNEDLKMRQDAIQELLKNPSLFERKKIKRKSTEVDYLRDAVYKIQEVWLESGPLEKPPVEDILSWLHELSQTREEKNWNLDLQAKVTTGTGREKKTQLISVNWLDVLEHALKETSKRNWDQTPSFLLKRMRRGGNKPVPFLTKIPVKIPSLISPNRDDIIYVSFADLVVDIKNSKRGETGKGTPVQLSTSRINSLKQQYTSLLRALYFLPWIQFSHVPDPIRDFLLKKFQNGEYGSELLRTDKSLKINNMTQFTDPQGNLVDVETYQQLLKHEVKDKVLGEVVEGTHLEKLTWLKSVLESERGIHRIEKRLMEITNDTFRQNQVQRLRQANQRLSQFLSNPESVFGDKGFISSQIYFNPEEADLPTTLKSITDPFHIIRIADISSQEMSGPDEDRDLIMEMMQLIQAFDREEESVKNDSDEPRQKLLRQLKEMVEQNGVELIKSPQYRYVYLPKAGTSSNMMILLEALPDNYLTLDRLESLYKLFLPKKSREEVVLTPSFTNEHPSVLTDSFVPVLRNKILPLLKGTEDEIKQAEIEPLIVEFTKEYRQFLEENKFEDNEESMQRLQDEIKKRLDKLRESLKPLLVFQEKLEMTEGLDLFEMQEETREVDQEEYLKTTKEVAQIIIETLSPDVDKSILNNQEVMSFLDQTMKDYDYFLSLGDHVEAGDVLENSLKKMYDSYFDIMNYLENYLQVKTEQNKYDVILYKINESDNSLGARLDGYFYGLMMNSSKEIIQVSSEKEEVELIKEVNKLFAPNVVLDDKKHEGFFASLKEIAQAYAQKKAEGFHFDSDGELTELTRDFLDEEVLSKLFDLFKTFIDQQIQERGEQNDLIRLDTRLEDGELLETLDHHFMNDLRKTNTSSTNLEQKTRQSEFGNLDILEGTEFEQKITKLLEDLALNPENYPDQNPQSIILTPNKYFIEGLHYRNQTRTINMILEQLFYREELNRQIYNQPVQNYTLSLASPQASEASQLEMTVLNTNKEIVDWMLLRDFNYQNGIYSGIDHLKLRELILNGRKSAGDDTKTSETARNQVYRLFEIAS